MIPPNINPDFSTKIYNQALKTGADVSNKINGLIKSLKSNLQKTEMDTPPSSSKEKTPSLLQQGRKAIGDAWTEGKKDISSKMQNLGIGRMLHEQSSKIIERLKANHNTAPKSGNVSNLAEVKVNLSSQSTTLNLLNLAKKDPPASAEELKEAGKMLFKTSSRVDNDELKIISSNLKADQLSYVIVGALKGEIENHTSAGNVLRANTTGNQLLSEFGRLHLGEEFSQSDSLQSLLSNIPNESLGDRFVTNEKAVPAAKTFLNEYFQTTQSLLESKTPAMSLFKNIIKETSNNIDSQFPEDKGAGATAGVNLLFLRVLNPIITTPEARGIKLEEKRGPDKMANALLFSKIAQNMANGVTFGDKEEKMVVFNGLLNDNKAKMDEVKDRLSA